MRPGLVTGSRETFTVGNDSDLTHSRMAEASPATMHKMSGGHRSSLLGGSSDPRYASSGKNASGIKNYESTVKGIESLHFDDEGRAH